MHGDISFVLMVPPCVVIDDKACDPVTSYHNRGGHIYMYIYMQSSRREWEWPAMAHQCKFNMQLHA